MEDKNSFGNYLKYLREDYGYTLNELASTIGYSGAYLSQIEKGRKPAPSFEMLEVLSKTLKTPYSGLLKKAGYVGLAEGQYYKELFSNIRMSENNALVTDEGLEHAKNLMNINFDGVVEWTKDKRFSEEQRIILIEHFSEMLIRYKRVIEQIASATEKWTYANVDLKKISNEEVSMEDIKRIFLKVELEKSIYDLTDWANALANTKVLAKKNNV